MVLPQPTHKAQEPIQEGQGAPETGTLDPWTLPAALGELHVTDGGRPVARLVPATVAVAMPYLSRRKLLPAFRATQAAGRGDSTAGISAKRDER
jgi:hypothetical protein